jgi:hypothetical protein
LIQESEWSLESGIVGSILKRQQGELTYFGDPRHKYGCDLSISEDEALYTYPILHRTADGGRGHGVSAVLQWTTLPGDIASKEIDDGSNFMHDDYIQSVSVGYMGRLVATWLEKRYPKRTRLEISSRERRRIQAIPMFRDLYEPYVLYYVKKLQATFRRNEAIQRVYTEKGYKSKMIYAYENRTALNCAKKLEVQLLEVRVRRTSQLRKRSGDGSSSDG